MLARVYAARRVSDPHELTLRLDRLLPPEQLLGCAPAASRLADALACGERLLLVGDFDADGATSCALAVRALRAMGAASVGFLVPNRFEYGYGLSPEIVALASERDPQVLITVDNGIASHAGVAAARALGMTVIVTDHHLPGETLPDADVIVNPNQPGCGFPSKHLAGVGVVFYLMLALRAELRRRDWFGQRGLAEPNLGQLLDLVALGTVADVVPLDYNNRILVQAGLARIRAGRACAGIRALLRVAGREPANVVAADLGFAVGPRLNAVGRLDDMSRGIECLLADDEPRAGALAAELDALNRERRSIERDMQAEALGLLERTAVDLAQPPPALVLFEPGWHQGVIGILASRIKDRAHRPVVAFADAGDGLLKGSARSIRGIHIRDVLAAVDSRQPGLIERFGGHAMAAGLTLRADRVDAFRAALLAQVEQQCSPADFTATVETDGELEPQWLQLELAELLRVAGPWGQQFPEPVFEGAFEVLNQRLVGNGHLKLLLRAGQGDQLIDAIAFNVDTACWPDAAVSHLHLVYRLDVNHYRGQCALQLVVEQLEPAAAPV